MAKAKIKVLPLAQEDMKSIVAYIRLDDPDAALRMAEKIKTSVGRLAEHPLSGPVPLDGKVAAQGYRMLVIDPYLVFYLYLAEESVVEIHRVLHGRQKYPNLFSP